jgi:hypothetical protein
MFCMHCIIGRTNDRAWTAIRTGTSLIPAIIVELRVTSAEHRMNTFRLRVIRSLCCQGREVAHRGDMRLISLVATLIFIAAIVNRPAIAVAVARIAYISAMMHVRGIRSLVIQQVHHCCLQLRTSFAALSLHMPMLRRRHSARHLRPEHHLRLLRHAIRTTSCFHSSVFVLMA